MSLTRSTCSSFNASYITTTGKEKIIIEQQETRTCREKIWSGYSSFGKVDVLRFFRETDQDMCMCVHAHTDT